MIDKYRGDHLDYSLRLKDLEYDLSNAKRQSAYRRDKYSGGPERTRHSHQPTYAPSPVHFKIPEYKHPKAQRENRMLKEYLSKHKISNFEKVKPYLYGSNSHWDLGLCKAHFPSPGDCKYGEGCEWGHAELSEKEKLYMSQLGDAGKGFLMSLNSV